ncbi:DUF4198 domain-containing protein [Niabella ginsengisoli]|uniref:DUF4198 domain-containing protein n=1 Tax=Niabella ginsengisoli TaxID=522298 RepID=A0ABS9SP27_9BACT|nr:DUF4198 domain-containing protein [Niabella ginsengisoli]MCH5600114.1 DUF4198 domain-containing protein [Niabella ginsengisoli]
MKKIVFALLMLLACNLSWAHAVWIETQPTGIKNKAQEIKVFFGEYADKDITAADKWFSDLKDFKIIAIAPDGSVETLSTSISTDHYKASFTPKQDGVYTISLQHPVKDLYHGTQLHYFSSATVKVGSADNGNDAIVNKNLLSLLAKDAATAQKDKEIKVIAMLEGKPAKSKEIQVFAPNGWSKTLWANEAGEITFTPLWSGLYQVEFSHTDSTAKEENGKKIEKTFNGATYMLFVK